MNKLKTIILIIVFGLECSITLATGPSHISSKLNPVAINASGEILCKTRFTENGMGAHQLMDVHYGYCIIITDSIIDITTEILRTDTVHDWDLCYKNLEKMDAFFESQISWDNPTQFEKKLIEKYKFQQINLELNKIHKEYNLEKMDANLKSRIQHSIKNGRSTNYYSNKILISHEFENIYIVSNLIGYHEIDLESTSIGAEFDYPNMLEIEPDSIINIGFDLYDVTGVLYKK